MTIPFIKWLENRLERNARADIDRETVRELFPDETPFHLYHFITDEANDLRTDWGKWITQANNEYRRIYNEDEGTNQQRQIFIHHWLNNIFYIEYKVITTLFDEYYSNYFEYDQEYFDTIISNFRKYFPIDHRYNKDVLLIDGLTEPSIHYFDDIILKYLGKFKTNETRIFTKPEPKNEHPEIFVNGYAWELFNDWFENQKHFTDLCFIYWKMKGENLMYKTVIQKCYIEFLNKEPFDFDFHNNFRPESYHYNSNLEQLYQISKNKFIP